MHFSRDMSWPGYGWSLTRAAALAGKVTSAAALSGASLVTVVAFFGAFPKPWLYLRQDRWTPRDDGLKYKEMCLRDGAKAWLLPGKSGDAAICLCHGRSKNKGHLRPLICSLAPDYTVLVFDFLGHGANAYGTTTLGWREAATVKHAIDALQQEGFQRVLLYGCSMGGAAALISQAHHPNAVVKGIITDGTFANFRDIFSDLVTRNAWWMPRFLRNLVSSASFHLVGLLAGYDPHDVRPADSLKQISLPVLILHGKSDRTVDPDNAQQLMRCAKHGSVLLYAGGHDDPSNAEVQSALWNFAKKLL